MIKPAFLICENKAADQLRITEQLISAFIFANSKIPLLPKSEILSIAIFCCFTVRFVPDLSRDTLNSDNQGSILPPCNLLVLASAV